MLRVVTHTAATNLLIQFLALGSSLLVARMLGPSGRGELATVMLWPMLLAHICLLGTDIGIARYASRSSGTSLHAVSVNLSILLGCTAIVGGYFLLPQVLPAEKLIMLDLSRWALAVIPLSMLNVLLFSSELGNQRFNNFNLARFAFAFVYLIAVLSVYVHGLHSVGTALGAFVGASFASTCVTGFLSIRSGTKNTPSQPLWSSTLRVLRTSQPFAISSIVLTTVERYQFLLLVFFCDLEALGLYTVAFSLSAAHMSVGGAVSKVLFAKLAGLKESETLDTQWFTRTLRQLTAGYFVLSIVMLCGLQLLVPLTLGEKYVKCLPLLYLLIPATTLTALTNVFDDTLKGRWGAATPGVYSRLIGISVLTIAAYFLFEQMGVMGIGIALLLKSAAEYLTLASFTCRRLQIKLHSLALPRMPDLTSMSRRIVLLSFGTRTATHE